MVVKTPDRSLVSSLVLSVLNDSYANENTKPQASTQLFGPGGILDSLGLVRFVIDVEQRLEQETGIAITIADEKAMSQNSNPFLTVDSLTDYICLRIGEQN